MWFTKKYKQEITELKEKIFFLERQLFEAQSFEKIACDKLTVWVKKHDELLIKHKELLKSLNK